jgi:hypothetical protein
MSGAGEEEPGEARVGRKPDKLPPQRRDRGLAPRDLDPAEHLEEAKGLVNSLGLRGVEPGKPLGLAEGKELEERAGEVSADGFG